MSGLRPSKWLWGLIPLSLVAILILTGLVPQIERDLQKRSSSALKQADIAWAMASFKGRDAFLRGIATDSDERDRALDVVRGVWGVRNIEDRITLLERASPYTWWANRKEGRLRIKGFVPDGSDRHTILGIVKAMMPELEIDDRMKRAAGAPPREVWVGAISFALNLLADLKEGTASLVDTQLSLTGEASNAEAYGAMRERLTTQLPAGITLNQMDLTPPLATPFTWTALYETGSLTISGNVPSYEARGEVVKSANELFGPATVIDRTELASGAPDNWTLAVVTALTQLSRLESGKAAFADTDLAFEGTAVDEATAKDVANKVRLGLPAIYKSTEEVGHSAGSSPPKNKRSLQPDGGQRANAGKNDPAPSRDTAPPL